eukprot:SM000288S10777  [mRNA]  locus=s288:20804:22129:+ [translate_table: standard]
MGGRPPLSWRERLRVLRDVALGLEYLHDSAPHSVVHRDVKSANILLDADGRARVADFGLSREQHAPQSGNVQGTIGYVDPAYCRTLRFTTESDVYSYGVLAFEVMTGRSPEEKLVDYVGLAAVEIDGAPPAWAELRDPRLDDVACPLDEFAAVASLAFRCLHAEPAARPHMAEIAVSLACISASMTDGDSVAVSIHSGSDSSAITKTPGR